MTMTHDRKPYIGPSESQAIANAKATDKPFLEQNWRSRDRRRQDPPNNVDGLVSWFREQWELEMPARIHSHGLWHDRVSAAEREMGVQAVGGSLLGTPDTSGPMRTYTEASVYARDDDGSLVKPLAASMAALRHERRYGHDVVKAVAYSYFDWRSLIGKPFYRKEHRHGKGPWCACSRAAADDVTETTQTLVMAMPEDILETVLRSALERLWYLLAEREPHITSATA